MISPLKKKLTFPLIGVLVLIVISVGGFFYFDKLFSIPVQIKDIKIDAKAALKLNALNQISKKNGITEWELKASSATLLKDEDKAILLDVSVIFFTKDNKKVLITSDKGVLDTKNHDMDLSDNVLVNYETFALKTDKLHYNKKEHILSSDAHVKLEKKDSAIEADAMTIHLNNHMTTLEGHVKGNFSENFNHL